MAEMTEQQIDLIVDKAVDAAFLRLGIDNKDPLEMQSDMLFLRNLKKTCDSIGSKIVMVVVGVITLGILGGCWLAVRKAMGL